MEYCHLGRSGLHVSRLCLGTGNFGTGGSEKANWGTVGEAEAFQIMDAALDAGINFFDTANVYGGLGHRGYTEEIIGRWFAQGGGRREKTVLATKVGRIMEEDETDGPNKPEGLSLYKIRRHFEASLRRLQTDHVELLQMHKVDRRVTWDELWEAFEGLVRQGKLDYVGSSNSSAWDIMKAQHAAKDRHFMGLVSEQTRYDLLGRLAELEIIPAATDLGIGLTIFSPLVRGLLGIDMLSPLSRPISDVARAQMGGYKTQLVAFSHLCRDLGEAEATVALAWTLSHEAISSVIIGPCSVADLHGLLRSVELKLDAPTLQKLDDIFPGPGPYSTSTNQRLCLPSKVR
jgi:aryl-alcohol dehydrogenase-like predicted oxidoreductase